MSTDVFTQPEDIYRLNGAHAFIIVFDWSNERSIEDLSSWIQFAKSFDMAPRPVIFLLGTNVDLIPKDKEMELKIMVERIKAREFVFSEYSLKSNYAPSIAKDAKIVLRAVLQDAKTAEQAELNKHIFKPCEDPDWNFKLV